LSSDASAIIGGKRLRYNPVSEPPACHPVPSRSIPLLPILGLTWGLAALLLALFLPLIVVAPGVGMLAAALPLLATVATAVPYHRSPRIPAAMQAQAWNLEQRVRELEAYCTRDRGE
jgi:hypothetical protein